MGVDSGDVLPWNSFTSMGTWKWRLYENSFAFCTSSQTAIHCYQQLVRVVVIAPWSWQEMERMFLISRHRHLGIRDRIGYLLCESVNARTVDVIRAVKMPC